MNTKHPDDLIYDTKTFIANLSKTQDWQFQLLVEELGLNETGEKWLFDYVFNHGDDETFEEYLGLYNKTMDEMVRLIKIEV